MGKPQLDKALFHRLPNRLVGNTRSTILLSYIVQLLMAALTAADIVLNRTQLKRKLSRENWRLEALPFRRGLGYKPMMVCLKTLAVR
jgi:hypothetical protein